MSFAGRTREQLVEEVAELRERLRDAEETLRAIREGEADALVITERQQDEKVYALKSVRAEENLRLLADAGAMPTEALDLAATLQRAARLAVSGFADWCVIDLAAEEGRIERVVAAHADPGRQALIEELKRFPPRGDEPHGPALVLRTGRSQRLAQWSPECLESVGQDPEHRRTFAALEPRSSLQVPLAARGRILGVWSFYSSSSRRSYDESDQELAEELGRRAALAIDNARLYGAAQAANLAKDKFLATLSHELRTPLTPVLAVISSLEGDDRLEVRVRESLAMVRRNVELEARLIDDLLDLTRIARGKLELSRRQTDLRLLLEQAVENCCGGQDMASGRLIVVKDLAAADFTVWADSPRLSQVFGNLLNNAVKFTPSGGTITVRSWSEARSRAETEGEEIVVQISDTGIGIRPGALGQIFNAFEQGDQSISHRFGGLGLGLAISKAIVELHGGRLSAESEGIGRGATFTVRLPVGRRRQEAAKVVGAERRGAPRADESHPLHILLAEDHADTAEALAALLEGLGHRITMAGTVAGALEAAAAADAPIDLVISDLGLPDGSGLDLMRELSRRHHLPGIALSGYGMEEDIEKSRQAGFARHLTKPVTLDLLKDVIDQVRERD